MNRHPKGSPQGGQYAPDRRGKTPPSASTVNTSPEEEGQAKPSDSVSLLTDAFQQYQALISAGNGSHAYRGTFLVTLKEKDEQFGLNAGDILVVRESDWDPDEKYEVLHRLSDGYDPSCSVYKGQVDLAEMPLVEEECGECDGRGGWLRAEGQDPERCYVCGGSGVLTGTDSTDESFDSRF